MSLCKVILPSFSWFKHTSQDRATDYDKIKDGRLSVMDVCTAQTKAPFTQHQSSAAAVAF